MGKLIKMKKDVETGRSKTTATTTVPAEQEQITTIPAETYQPEYIDMMTSPELRTLQEIKFILAIILIINIICLFRRQ